MASSLELLGFELARSLASLGRSLQSRRGVVGILRALGWEPPPGGVVPDFGGIRLAELIAQLETTRQNVAAAQIAASGGAISVSLNLGYAELFLRVRDVLNDLDGGVSSLATLPVNYLAQTQIRTEFVPRLLNYAIARALAANHPSIYQALAFLNVIQIEHLPADEARFQILQSLGARFQMRFLTAEDEQLILGRVVPEADTDPLPQVQMNLLQGTLDSRFEVGLLLSALRATAPGGADGGISLGPLLRGTTEQTFSLSGDWKLNLASQVDLSPGVAVFQRAGQAAKLIVDLRDARVSTNTGDSFRVSLQYSPSNAPRPLLVIPGGSRLEYREFVATLGARAAANHAELFVEIALQGGRFVLSLEGAGQLLRALIPKDAVRADCDFALGFAGGRAYLRGGAALQATFPVHRSLGPVELQTVVVGLAPGAAGALPIEVSASVRATVGPLSMVLERIGMTAAFDVKGGGSGNLGPLDVDLNFKPPAGIGLDLDAGPITGGGHLTIDSAGRRYGGVLQLKLTKFNVVAYGIYEEVGGDVSFVAVLGIRFTPGIQLGFGFALTGVGGLVGLNRRANVDLLRERLAGGSAGNVLFCEDPVRNAPTILGDLAAFFPTAAGGFLVGPTVQIGWLAPLVRIDLGILIELPGPSKIVILGTFRAMMGPSETLALLYLRMDVLGIIDFEKRLISLDAALVSSHALGVFRLTGGMAFRLDYGSNPYVLLSIGGFHPRFDPGPLNIPSLARVGASLDINVAVSIYVRLELYVAFTSNTLQAGAKVDAGMDIGPLSARGYFYFDALIQFRPFYFTLDFAAGFAVEVFGLSFCSVDISGTVSGPGPIVIHARGSIRRLFLKVSGSATFELGDRNADRPVPIASPVRELAPELRQTANLRTEGDDPVVVLRPGRPAVQGVLVSPKGSLIWEQKRAPLNTIIHRLGGVPLAGQHELRLDAPAGWTTASELDWFNAGAFTNFDLQASQALNNATFQELPSGVRVGSQADARAATIVEYTDEIDLFKRPAKTWATNLMVGTYLTGPLHAAARDRTMTPAVDPGKAKVAVKPETADVCAADGAVLLTGQTPFQAFQLARQEDGWLAVPTSDVRVSL